MGGCRNKLPEISEDSYGLFAQDGVHLSRLGYDIFLNLMQGALEKITNCDDCNIFPLAGVVGPWLSFKLRAILFLFLFYFFCKIFKVYIVFIKMMM